MEKGEQITDGDAIVLEIRRILLYWFYKQRPEYLVECTSFNAWIHNDVLYRIWSRQYDALPELHSYKKVIGVTDISAH
jgi:hypothetical protein